MVIYYYLKNIHTYIEMIIFNKGEPMKNKLKNNIIIKLFLVCIIFGLFITQNKTRDDNNSISGHADWINHFEDFNALINASDIIIKGKKIDSYPEQRVNMIFTKEIIEVSKVYKGSLKKDDTIEILQTGGEYNNIKTSQADEAPLLEKNGNYLLFLQTTDEGHYLILGGYQGVGKIKNKKLKFNVENDKIAKQLKGKDLSEIEGIISKE